MLYTFYGCFLPLISALCQSGALTRTVLHALSYPSSTQPTATTPLDWTVLTIGLISEFLTVWLFPLVLAFPMLMACQYAVLVAMAVVEGVRESRAPESKMVANKEGRDTTSPLSKIRTTKYHQGAAYLAVFFGFLALSNFCERPLRTSLNTSNFTNLNNVLGLGPGSPLNSDTSTNPSSTTTQTSLDFYLPSYFVYLSSPSSFRGSVYALIMATLFYICGWAILESAGSLNASGRTSVIGSCGSYIGDFIMGILNNTMFNKNNKNGGQAPGIEVVSMTDNNTMNNDGTGSQDIKQNQSIQIQQQQQSHSKNLPLVASLFLFASMGVSMKSFGLCLKLPNSTLMPAMFDLRHVEIKKADDGHSESDLTGPFSDTLVGLGNLSSYLPYSQLTGSSNLKSSESSDGSSNSLNGQFNHVKNVNDPTSDVSHSHTTVAPNAHDLKTHAIEAVHAITMPPHIAAQDEQHQAQKPVNTQTQSDQSVTGTTQTQSQSQSHTTATTNTDASPVVTQSHPTPSPSPVQTQTQTQTSNHNVETVTVNTHSTENAVGSNHNANGNTANGVNGNSINDHTITTITQPAVTGTTPTPSPKNLRLRMLSEAINKNTHGFANAIPHPTTFIVNAQNLKLNTQNSNSQSIHSTHSHLNHHSTTSNSYQNQSFFSIPYILLFLLARHSQKSALKAAANSIELAGGHAINLLTDVNLLLSYGIGASVVACLIGFCIYGELVWLSIWGEVLSIGTSLGLLAIIAIATAPLGIRHKGNNSGGFNNNFNSNTLQAPQMSESQMSMGSSTVTQNLSTLSDIQIINMAQQHSNTFNPNLHGSFINNTPLSQMTSQQQSSAPLTPLSSNSMHDLQHHVNPAPMIQNLYSASNNFGIGSSSSGAGAGSGSAGMNTGAQESVQVTEITDEFDLLGGITIPTNLSENLANNMNSNTMSNLKLNNNSTMSTNKFNNSKNNINDLNLIDDINVSSNVTVNSNTGKKKEISSSSANTDGWEIEALEGIDDDDY